MKLKLFIAFLFAILAVLGFAQTPSAKYSIFIEKGTSVVALTPIYQLTDVAGKRGFNASVDLIAGVAGENSAPLGGFAATASLRLAKEADLILGLGAAIPQKGKWRPGFVLGVSFRGNP